MGQLANEAKKRSSYLTLETEESIVAVYKGYKMVPSSFDPDRDSFRFILEIEINGEKQTKYWDTGSNKIALIFDAVKVGEEVKITKHEQKDPKGKGKFTWEVVPLNAKIADNSDSQEEE